MIRGVELTFSIIFDEIDKRTYINKVSEIQNKITDVIKELNHNFIIGSGKPILQSEMKE